MEASITDESTTEFHDRRAIEEKALAEKAPDVVQAIAHDQLSKLHAQNALDHDAAPPLETALEVAAVDGTVAVASATGEVTRLTPNAANLTSDLLLARAHEAGRQVAPPSFLQPSAKLKAQAKRADDKEADSDMIPTTGDSAAERAR